MIAATHSAAAPRAVVKASPKLLPIVATVVSVGAVVGYVRSQLAYERRVMDGRFAQYNSSQSEQARAKSFEGTNSDPRTSVFNILGH